VVPEPPQVLGPLELRHATVTLHAITNNRSQD